MPTEPTARVHETKRFRGRWSSLMIVGLVTQYFTIMFLMNLNLLMMGWWRASSFPLSGFAIMLAAITLYSVLAVSVVWWAMTLRVRRDSIRGWSVFGLPVSLNWTDIIEIKPNRFAGIDWATLVTANGKKLMLSSRFWYTQPDELRVAIAQHAGEEHILTKWLREEWDYLDQ
jgi:hypothetical protein